jgi:hypothetical protein
MLPLKCTDPHFLGAALNSGLKLNKTFGVSIRGMHDDKLELVFGGPFKSIGYYKRDFLTSWMSLHLQQTIIYSRKLRK